MNRQLPHARLNTFEEETVLFPANSSAPATVNPKREIVHSSGPHLTNEKQALLRLRLRAAAFILLVGFGVFLVRHVVGVFTGESLYPLLLGAHILTVLVLGWSLPVAAVADVFGTHLINTLRREAFEAKQLGQYRLIAPLGAGGMGEVYLAEHRMLKRPCAVKLIRSNHAGDPQVLARFEREVQTTARLSHWNTVEIYDYGRTDDGTFFYVMEYLRGLSLEELLERHGPLPAERVVHLLRQTCQALREAHAVGLIHRDIKPGNIFAAQRGGLYDVAKLLDFGLVKPVAEIASARLTQDGAISGTPLFMSPEQARGLADLDARSDIYSLGAVAYALLTGHAPFERKNPLDVIIAHDRDVVVPLTKVRPDVPVDLERVVLRCLAKRPEDRFQDVENLEQALCECVAADQWTQSDSSHWWQEHDRASAPARETRTGTTQRTERFASSVVKSAVHRSARVAARPRRRETVARIPTQPVGAKRCLIPHAVVNELFNPSPIGAGVERLSTPHAAPRTPS